MKTRGSFIHIHSVFILCFTVLLVVGGCKPKSGGSTSSNQTRPPSEVADSLILVTNTEEKDRGDFKKQVRDFFEKEDFAKLESMAGDFRTNKVRFRNGGWKLHTFYNAFGNSGQKMNDDLYKVQIDRGQRWMKAYPRSITPRIVLATIYIDYAWHARGGDWADKVTDQGWRLMAQRLQAAMEYLRDGAKLGVKCPDWYYEAQRIGLGEQWDRKTFDKVVEGGVKNFPDYFPIYEWKAYYLLPRWYGNGSEWESFAMETMKREDIPAAKEVFARIAITFRDMGFFYQEFSGTDKSWDALKESFHEIERKYPDSLEVKSIFCLMSAKFCDYKEAREQMKLLDHKVDLSVWDSESNFLAFASWANNSDAELEKCRQEWKSQHQK